MNISTTRDGIKHKQHVGWVNMHREKPKIEGRGSHILVAVSSIRKIWNKLNKPGP